MRTEDSNAKASAHSAGTPTQAGSTHSESTGRSAAAGISQFIAKVLEQLSLSSWLPATMLVGNAALLLQMHALRQFDLNEAIKDLIKQQWGILVVLLFALIIAAIVIQAFEFEVVRLLEGYFDSAHRIPMWLIGTQIRRHQRRRKRLETKWDTARQRAFSRARPRVLDDGEADIEPRHLDVIESCLFHRPIPAGTDKKTLRKANNFDWLDYARPDDAYALDALSARRLAFPDESRLLPTNLGNALRSAEDQLTLDDEGDIEGFVIRHNDALPATLRTEVEDYRTRLDMYCSLVLVFLILAVLAVVTLSGLQSDPWAAEWVAVLYVVLSWVAYQSAVVSARGYGQGLLEIDRFIASQTEVINRKETS
jgi:hypothetical protein